MGQASLHWRKPCNVRKGYIMEMICYFVAPWVSISRLRVSAERISLRRGTFYCGADPQLSIISSPPTALIFEYLRAHGPVHEQRSFQRTHCMPTPHKIALSGSFVLILKFCSDPIWRPSAMFCSSWSEGCGSCSMLLGRAWKRDDDAHSSSITFRDERWWHISKFLPSVKMSLKSELWEFSQPKCDVLLVTMWKIFHWVLEVAEELARCWSLYGSMASWWCSLFGWIICSLH